MHFYLTKKARVKRRVLRVRIIGRRIQQGRLVLRVNPFEQLLRKRTSKYVNFIKLFTSLALVKFTEKESLIKDMKKNPINTFGRLGAINAEKKRRALIKKQNEFKIFYHKKPITELSNEQASRTIKKVAVKNIKPALINTNPFLISKINNQNKSALQELPSFKPFAPLNGPIVSKFIKSMSKFNPEIASYQSISYTFNKTNNNNIKNVYESASTVLKYAFRIMSCLISKPRFLVTPEKIEIRLFYYHSKKIGFKSKPIFFSLLNSKKIQFLCVYLTKLFNRSVELKLVRLYYPYFDSNTLAELIGINSNIVKFRFITKKLFKSATVKNPTKMVNKATTSKIPSYLTGIKIRVAGRLATQRVIPRITVKTHQRGRLARGKTSFVDTARFTNKNRRGTFSITVSIGHRLV